MSRVVYTLSAEVDGVQVFNQGYDDSADLLEDLYKAERAVEINMEPDEFMKDWDDVA